jgi:hypothetical protein
MLSDSLGVPAEDYEMVELWAMAEQIASDPSSVDMVEMRLRLAMLHDIAHNMLCPPLDRDHDIPELWAAGAQYLIDRGFPEMGASVLKDVQ